MASAAAMLGPFAFVLDSGSESRFFSDHYTPPPCRTPQASQLQGGGTKTLRYPFANISNPRLRESNAEAEGGYDSDNTESPEVDEDDVGVAPPKQAFDFERRYYDLADLKVILRYGGGLYCFLVASHALCMASKVWKRIIHPNGFRQLEYEPHGPDGDTIKVIRLEDDAANTLDIIFNIIHLRTDSIPKKLSFRRLRQMAIICDKYECGKALGPWPRMWMHEHIENATTPGFEDWLFVAKVLDPTQTRVKDITRNLILHSTSKSSCGTYMQRHTVNTATNPVEVNLELMPDNIKDYVFKERGYAIRKVTNMLRQFVSEMSCVSFSAANLDGTRPISFCSTCSDIALGSLIRSLKVMYLWPLMHADTGVEWHASLQELVDRIEAIRMTTLIHSSGSAPVVPARVSSFTATGTRASWAVHKRMSSASTIGTSPFIGPSGCRPPIEDKMKITREARSNRPNKPLDYGYASVMGDLKYEFPAFHKDSYHQAYVPCSLAFGLGTLITRCRKVVEKVSGFEEPVLSQASSILSARAPHGMTFETPC